jgi:hypothetical protein
MGNISFKKQHKGGQTHVKRNIVKITTNLAAALAWQ